MRMSRTTSSLVPASTSRSAMSSRSELVPQSKAATRVMLARPSACRLRVVSRRLVPRTTDGYAGPELHHSPELVEHLVAERVDPTALGQRLAGEHVQALHPVGHATGGDARDLGHLADLGAGSEVGMVGSQVRRSELVVLGQPLGHLAHQAGSLQGADHRGRPRAGQVERRRERCSVVEPGLGRDDVRVAARTAVSHCVDRPRWPAELGGHGSDVALCDARVVAGRGRAHWPGEGVGSAGGGVMLDFGVGVFFGWSAASRVP